ncbi:TIR domain-containing protein [Geodermatophilus sp. SYSU D01176]
MRFFIAESASSSTRYTALAGHLHSHGIEDCVSMPMWVDDAIAVNDSTWPMVQSEWIEGRTLDAYVAQLTTKADLGALAQLAGRWRHFVSRLQAAEFAHGDLAHGNVLVDTSGSFRLVDFDRSWIPACRSESPPPEIGHPNYQRPDSQWGRWMDTFPGLVIYTSLLALSRRPDLWRQLHNGENMLFTQDDLAPPFRTRAWTLMHGIRDPDVELASRQLMLACAPAWRAEDTLEALLGFETQVNITHARRPTDTTIFVSCSRIDEDVARSLARLFEAAGRKVRSDLEGGVAQWDTILDGIRSATVFVFLLSDESLHSKRSRQELNYALALGRPVLPVQAGHVTEFPATPLADPKIISFRPDDAVSAFNALAAVDEAATHARPLPDPLPKPPPVPFEYLLRLGSAIGAAQLTPDQQGDFIRHLREVLETEDDEGARDDARDLLGALRRRPDVTYRNAQAIDRLLTDLTARDTPGRLFVSYSRQDGTAVEELVADLQRVHLSVSANRELGGGDPWWQDILRQIRECDVFLFCLSRNSLASKPCLAELSYARALGLPILSVQVGPVGKLRLTPVADIQVVDYQERTLANGVALLDAIQQAASARRPLPDPLPKSPPIPFAYLIRLGSAIGTAQLTPDQQSEFIGQLREALDTEDDENLRETARELLLALRSRADLTRRNFDRIDRLLTELQYSEDLPKYGKAFLCHSSGDKERVRNLYHQLKRDGVPCWFDEEDLLPGQDWEDEIRKAIRACQYVLACLSQASITKTGYVQKELNYALDVADEQPPGSIFLIPVLLEPCEVPDRLKKRHWAELYNPSGYQRLLKSLAFKR